jgi:hypothetical protein
MMRRYGLLSALVITVPVALLLALSASATLQAEGTAPPIGSSTVAQVGYGDSPVRVKVGNTVTRLGAGSGAVLSDLSVADPSVALAVADARGAVTLIRIIGLSPGNTIISWNVDGVPHEVMVVVFDN